MSYESRMLERLKMPVRAKVEEALLVALFRHNGVIREFGSTEEIVDEVANEFGLDGEQRSACLETVYRKERRVKRSSLWHRLLFRAADSLAKEKMISRPTQTLKLTNNKEWMLTERGFDEALRLSGVPVARKDFLSTKSFEVQKIVKEINETPRIEDYDPFDRNKKTAKITEAVTLRKRGFRQAVIEAYDYKCAVCGMKICSPDTLSWEVEAAHIVPHQAMGKDDICNGLALCRLHHWAFDIGWFALLDSYKVEVSSKASSLPAGFGRIFEYEFLKSLSAGNLKVLLPNRKEIYPHRNSIGWHRQNIFHK